MSAWKKAQPGIRYRQHPTRRHGILPDRYFTIYHKVDGRIVEEGLGWGSEGWTVEKVAKILADLKANKRKGTGPRTLKEQRDEQERELRKQEAEGLTVAEFWEGDYKNNLAGRMKDASADRELREFRLRIKPALGKKPLKDVTSADLERVIDRMRVDHLSPRTQDYFRGTFSRLWKRAAKRKLVKAGDNPAGEIKIKLGNNTRLRVLTSSELKTILDRVAGINTNDHAFTLFCALTGCRFSEAAGLTWEHVDFQRRVALFPETKNRDPREVYLVDPIFEILKRRGGGATGELVFLGESGKPYTEPPRLFRTVVKNLGLNKNRSKRDRVCFHTLRHTAATLAARRGTPVKDLQVVFGWRTPSMVFRYAKGDEGIQRQALEGVAQALTGEPAKVVPFKRKSEVAS